MGFPIEYQHLQTREIDLRFLRTALYILSGSGATTVVTLSQSIGLCAEPSTLNSSLLGGVVANKNISLHNSEGSRMSRDVVGAGTFPSLCWNDGCWTICVASTWFGPSRDLISIAKSCSGLRELFRDFMFESGSKNKQAPRGHIALSGPNSKNKRANQRHLVNLQPRA